MNRQKETTLFVDIGNIRLTNGWDRRRREKAADLFGMNYEEMNQRRRLTFGTYEMGRLSLEEYSKGSRHDR